jgi:peptide/nickel transport system permease protein
MRQYIIRRVLISLAVLLGISMALYSLIRAMPADYVTLSTSASQKITLEQKERLREIYGLNKGVLEGYAGWLINTLKGDFGISLIYARPVGEILARYMPVTVSVASIALFFEIMIGVPLGIVAAKHRNSKIDYAITAFVFIGISLPSFFFAAVLKKAFGFYGLNILPISGMLNPRVDYDSFTLEKLADYARHLILPITVFVFVSCGTWLRYTRASMIEALDSDYARTARAKGVPEFKVVYSHAFRNTLIPIITLLGGQLPVLFSGAMITENLFAIEGLGNIALKASNMSDVPYLMAFNMMLAFFTVLGYLISDVLYAVADPRIRLN